MTSFTAHDGTRLAYRDVGEGEPLLCLPGGPMRASAYFGDLGGLSARRRLFMLDLRGTGGSAVPADATTYRCERQVDDVEALREHLGLERVDLLGHSAAGDLAILYAARHPQRVRSLTLVTPCARPLGIEFTEDHRREGVASRKGEPWFEGAYEAFESVLAGSTSDGDRAAMAPFLYGRWDPAAQEHAAAGAGQRNVEAGGVYMSTSTFEPAVVREAVRALEAPVLVLAGEFDSGPLPRVAADIAELFPHAEVTVQSGAAHFPWLDDPFAFSSTVGTFLTRVAGD